MPELSVAIVAADIEQRSIMQVMVDGTGVARTVQAFGNVPGGDDGSGLAEDSHRKSGRDCRRYPAAKAILGQPCERSN